MGDPSSLHLIPASSVSTPINWTLVPEALKKILLDGWGYDWDNGVERPLPATVGDLVKMFDESKFFGYYRPTLLTLLMDISEFGLKTMAVTWEVLQGAAEFVGITKKLGGWDASMINQDLAVAQYVEAIQTLPISHLAYQGMMETMMSGICGGGGPLIF